MKTTAMISFENIWHDVAKKGIDTNRTPIDNFNGDGYVIETFDWNAHLDLKTNIKYLIFENAELSLRISVTLNKSDLPGDWCITVSNHYFNHILLVLQQNGLRPSSDTATSTIMLVESENLNEALRIISKFIYFDLPFTDFYKLNYHEVNDAILNATFNNQEITKTVGKVYLENALVFIFRVKEAINNIGIDAIVGGEMLAKMVNKFEIKSDVIHGRLLHKLVIINDHDFAEVYFDDKDICISFGEKSLGAAYPRPIDQPYANNHFWPFFCNIDCASKIYGLRKGILLGKINIELKDHAEDEEFALKA